MCSWELVTVKTCLILISRHGLKVASSQDLLIVVILLMKASHLHACT